MCCKFIPIPHGVHLLTKQAEAWGKQKRKKSPGADRWLGGSKSRLFVWARGFQSGAQTNGVPCLQNIYFELVYIEIQLKIKLNIQYF